MVTGCQGRRTMITRKRGSSTLTVFSGETRINQLLIKEISENSWPPSPSRGEGWDEGGKAKQNNPSPSPLYLAKFQRSQVPHLALPRLCKTSGARVVKILKVPIKENPLKIASWFFAFLLGALLVYAYHQIPPLCDSQIPFHLSARFIHQAGVETGIQSPSGAVLADYRSLDLFALGSLFFAALLTLILLFNAAPWSKILFPVFWGWAGMGMALGIGFLGLFYGSNFLDYEPLAFWAVPSQARVNGALILTLGALLSLGGLFLLLIKWVQTSEDSRER